MPTIKDYHLARVDMEKRLSVAIESWRSDRPRRWLSRHGNIVADGRHPLAQQYRILRYEAEGLLRRPRPESANGLVSHSLHLE